MSPSTTIADRAGAESTVAAISALGRRSFAVQANVGVAADVDRMFDEVLARFARLDVHVNNAGVQTWKPLLDLQEAEWDRVIDTNLKGCFLCTQRAARHMKDSGGGSIVNIGSGCNKIAFPNLVDYTASKGGIEMFTRVAGVELGPYGIRVNCVAPGAIEIERTKLEAGDYAGTWAKLTPLCPHRYARGRRKGGRVPGERRRNLRHLPDHLGRRRPVQQAAMALLECGDGSQPAPLQIRRNSFRRYIQNRISQYTSSTAMPASAAPARAEKREDVRSQVDAERTA